MYFFSAVTAETHLFLLTMPGDQVLTKVFEDAQSGWREDSRIFWAEGLIFAMVAFFGGQVNASYTSNYLKRR